jgi:hypothetical protein
MQNTKKNDGYHEKKLKKMTMVVSENKMLTSTSIPSFEVLSSCTQPVRLWEHTLKYTKKKVCGGFCIAVLNNCLHPYLMCGLLAMFAKSNIVVYLARGFLAICTL